MALVADAGTMQSALFKKIPGCPQGYPGIYYSSGKAWKLFLESPSIKNKNWMELVEIIVRDFETNEIRQQVPWVWFFDMGEQSMLYKVLLDNLPKITQYLMKRWENSLNAFYLVRPSTSTKVILKIVETILPRERLINLHRIQGGALELNNILDKMGRSIEERQILLGTWK